MKMKFLLLTLLVLMLLSGCVKKEETVETPVATESVETDDTEDEAKEQDEVPDDTSPTEEEKSSEQPKDTQKTEEEKKEQSSPPVIENKTEEKVPDSKEETPPKENVSQPKPVVNYNPNTIVQLATNKLKAIGKITLTDNLDKLLADGSITQEEYNEYYPYDGAGYYSVFMETNLEDARTTSGRKLSSEDEIAQYIADMLAIENGPYFLIEYAGTYTTGGNDFYEFRCYRA